MEFIGTDGNLRPVADPQYPVPVKIIGSASTSLGGVSALPYTTTQITNTTSTTVSATVASLSERLVVRITNQSATETVWIAENSPVATVSFGLPLLPYQYYEEILGPTIPVSYISSTTCKINLFQGK
jgi:hypothetical protein